MGKKKELPDYIMNYDQFASMDKFSFDITPGWVTKAEEFQNQKHESKETSDRKRQSILKSLKSKLPTKLGLVLEGTLWGNNINIDVIEDMMEIQIEHMPIKYFPTKEVSEAAKWIKEQFENR